MVCNSNDMGDMGEDWGQMNLHFAVFSVTKYIIMWLLFFVVYFKIM